MPFYILLWLYSQMFNPAPGPQWIPTQPVGVPHTQWVPATPPQPHFCRPISPTVSVCA